ncbi:MAG: metallophosphatase family protein [Blautia sp.]|nr:metallophosphatase family protein [Blautia sp.]MCM1199853.1 metallophosphatase family protein [Bacteroides fragilis]
MKLAVIGDIHSNHYALEACIKHALDKEVDEFLFLGDYISDCPCPQKTMRIVYEMQKRYRCRFIRGNREDYMLNHRKNPEERWTFSSASGNLLYTYENLSERDFQFYQELDIQGLYQKDGYPSFRYCHGSLTSSKELLLPENENLESIMKNLDVDLLIAGHTHIQKSEIYGNKKLIHPGSAGIPWYYGGKSQYMILHGTKRGWEEEFFQLEYPVDAVKEEFETSGLNGKSFYWAKLNLHALYTGEDYMTPCLKLAEKLCREAEGSVSWPDIPEKYWKTAAETFGIL